MSKRKSHAAASHATWLAERKNHDGQLRRAWTQNNGRAVANKRACRGRYTKGNR